MHSHVLVGCLHPPPGCLLCTGTVCWLEHALCPRVGAQGQLPAHAQGPSPTASCCGYNHHDKKNILGFRNQHLESPWSVHMKPRQQGPSTLSALGPPSQLILSPRRRLQTQPHPQPHVLRTLSKQVSGHDCCMQRCVGDTEHHGFHVLEH